MRSKSIYIFLLIAIILLAFVITHEKSYNFNEKFTLIEGDSSSPAMEYKFSAKQVKGLKNSLLTMFTEPSIYAESKFETLKNNYKAVLDLYRKFPDAVSLNYQYVEDAEVLFKNNKYTSLRFTSYAFTGGAHGKTEIEHWIVDRNSGEVLDFNDVFVKGNDKELKSLNDKYLQDIFQDQDIKEILFNEDYEVSRDIYLTRKGVIFQYDQYEIAAYSYGSIEVLVPYKELKPYLKIQR